MKLHAKRLLRKILDSVTAHIESLEEAAGIEAEYCENLPDDSSKIEDSEALQEEYATLAEELGEIQDKLMEMLGEDEA